MGATWLEGAPKRSCHLLFRVLGALRKGRMSGSLFWEGRGPEFLASGLVVPIARGPDGQGQSRLAACAGIRGSAVTFPFLGTRSVPGSRMSLEFFGIALF